MQARLAIYCEGCGKFLGKVGIDTADMPERLQEKINGVVLEHRKDCKYYSEIRLASAR